MDQNNVKVQVHKKRVFLFKSPTDGGTDRYTEVLYIYSTFCRDAYCLKNAKFKFLSI